MTSQTAYSSSGSGTVRSELCEAMFRLAAPAQAVHDGAKQAEEGQLPLVSVLLREIGETILPRELTVSAGKEAVAVLTVAQRRLAGVALASQQASGENADDPAAAARLYASRLRVLEAEIGDGGFSLLRCPCKSPEGAGNCTAEMLAEALGSATQCPLKRFQAFAEARVSALLSCGEDGQVYDAKGPDYLLRKLSAVQAGVAARTGKSASLRMPERRPECLLLRLPSELCIINAAVGGNSLLLALAPDEVAPVLEAWKQVFEGLENI